MNIFVMASGTATRFNGISKQLLPLNFDHTFLSRQMTQCIPHQPTIVTHNEEIILYADYHDYPHIAPADSSTVCNSILSTSHLWDERTIILLGDVIYSNKVMQQILTSQEPLMFFGDQWELFALSFDFSQHDQICESLKAGSHHRFGKLRYAYRAYSKLSLDHHDTSKTLTLDPNMQYTDCWITRDCDSPSVYVNIQNELISTHVLETQ